MTTETRPPNQAIKATLFALADILKKASVLATLASDNFDQGGLNLAIGTILPLGEMLPTAQALYQASIALHRCDREGGAQ